MAGKGGTGKTTLSALIIRHLQKKGLGPILAVDADPSSNLADALGLPVKQSLGTAREDFFETKGKLPPGMTKETYLEMKLHEILVESRGLDLLVMGRPEGPGCYCYANNILRHHLDILVKNYPFVVMDNEAGMEHLSRRTTQGVISRASDNRSSARQGWICAAKPANRSVKRLTCAAIRLS